MPYAVDQPKPSLTIWLAHFRAYFAREAQFEFSEGPAGASKFFLDGMTVDEAVTWWIEHYDLNTRTDDNEGRRPNGFFVGDWMRPKDLPMASVAGCHGRMAVDLGGGIWAYDATSEKFPDDPADTYENIVGFDVEEYAKYNRKDDGAVGFLDDTDILLIGYWMDDGVYEPPCHAHRIHLSEDENEDGRFDLNTYAWWAAFESEFLAAAKVTYKNALGVKGWVERRRKLKVSPRLVAEEWLAKFEIPREESK